MEVIEHIPDLALFEAGGLIGQDVLRDVLQEFVEDVIQSKEIDEVRGILPVGGGDVVEHQVRDILQPGPVVPNLIK